MTTTPHSIGGEQTLETASRMMREHHIRHLPVLHGGKLLGVLTDRDLKFIEAFRDVDVRGWDAGTTMVPALPYTSAY